MFANDEIARYMLAEKIAAEILTSAVHRSINGSVKSDLV